MIGTINLAGITIPGLLQRSPIPIIIEVISIRIFSVQGQVQITREEITITLILTAIQHLPEVVEIEMISTHNRKDSKFLHETIRHRREAQHLKERHHRVALNLREV